MPLGTVVMVGVAVDDVLVVVVVVAVGEVDEDDDDVHTTTECGSSRITARSFSGRGSVSKVASWCGCGCTEGGCAGASLHGLFSPRGCELVVLKGRDWASDMVMQVIRIGN